MQTDQIDRQELKDWIDTLDDEITLLLLQSLKKAPSIEDWFWENISARQKKHLINALKKAKHSNKYSLKELWEEIKYQYSQEHIEEFSEAQKKSLRRAEEDIKAGNLYTSEEVWAEINSRRNRRT